MKNNIQNLTFTAMMAALICVAGPIVIPIGMVPMSLANMAIYLTILLLDKKKAIISVAVYLLIGFIGLPVFSGFSGGVGKLFGPTGGYLIGYLVLSWSAGMFLEKLSRGERKKKESLAEKEEISKKREDSRGNSVVKQIFALAIGTVGLYFFGTVWLMYQSQLELWTALSVGVISFIPFDIVKMIAAVLLGNSIKKRLRFLE